MSFWADILKIDKPRNHKIKNSYIANHYFEFYKSKTHTKISQKQYTAIFKACIADLVERNLKQSLNIVLPFGLGTVGVVALPVEIITNNANEKQSTMPVNWKKTIQLWERDPECYKQRIVLHDFSNERLRLMYMKPRKRYRNMFYYTMMFNRQLKRMVYKNLVKNDNFNLNG